MKYVTVGSGFVRFANVEIVSGQQDADMTESDMTDSYCIAELGPIFHVSCFSCTLYHAVGKCDAQRQALPTLARFRLGQALLVS